MRIRKNFENIFRRVFINNFSFFFFFNIFESAFEARLTEGNFFFVWKIRITNRWAQVGGWLGYIRAASLIPACHSLPQKEEGEGDCSLEWKYAL